MSAIELKCLRESLHLSQTQLAGIVGVQDRTVRYWEAGKNLPPADVLDKLRDIDGCIDQRVESLIEQLTTEGFFDGDDTWQIITFASDASYQVSSEYWDMLPLSSLHRAWAIRAKKAIELMGGAADIVDESRTD